MTSKPVPIVFGEALVDAFADTLAPGGAPLNVACHLAAFGLAPLLLSRIGDDAAGAQLKATAKRYGLLLDGVQIDTVGTPRVLVREHHGQHSFHIPAESAFDHLDAETATVAVASRLPAGAKAWLYHGTLALRSPSTRRALAALRVGRNLRVFVDLNWRDSGPAAADILSLLRDIEVLKLSEAELTLVLGWLHLSAPSESRPREGCKHPSLAALARRAGARWVLVTYGGDGAACWDSTGCCRASVAAATPRRLIDTVGAGDAFSACMLAALLHGQDVRDALIEAVAFASDSCGWRGAMPADLHPYEIHSRLPSAPPSRLSRIDR